MRAGSIGLALLSLFLVHPDFAKAAGQNVNGIRSAMAPGLTTEQGWVQQVKGGGRGGFRPARPAAPRLKPAFRKAAKPAAPAFRGTSRVSPKAGTKPAPLRKGATKAVPAKPSPMAAPLKRAAALGARVTNKIAAAAKSTIRASLRAARKAPSLPTATQAPSVSRQSSAIPGKVRALPSKAGPKPRSHSAFSQQDRGKLKTAFSNAVRELPKTRSASPGSARAEKPPAPVLAPKGAPLGRLGPGGSGSRPAVSARPAQKTGGGAAIAARPGLKPALKSAFAKVSGQAKAVKNPTLQARAKKTGESLRNAKVKLDGSNIGSRVLARRLGTQRQTNNDKTRYVPPTALLAAKKYRENGLRALPGKGPLKVYRNLGTVNKLPMTTKTGKPITYFEARVLKQAGGDQRLVFGVVGKVRQASEGKHYSTHYTSTHYGLPTRNGVKVKQEKPRAFKKIYQADE